MSQFYVEAKSKKAVNETLKAGGIVYGISYNLFEGDKIVPSNEWDNGDVVKIFSKRVGGTPYAKAYGSVSIRDNVVKVK